MIAASNTEMSAGDHMYATKSPRSQRRNTQPYAFGISSLIEAKGNRFVHGSDIEEEEANLDTEFVVTKRYSFSQWSSKQTPDDVREQNKNFEEDDAGFDDIEKARRLKEKDDIARYHTFPMGDEDESDISSGTTTLRPSMNVGDRSMSGPRSPR
jgi:hypothetical protein